MRVRNVGAPQASPEVDGALSQARKRSMKWIPATYVVLLTCVCIHFYRAPEWTMDMVGYMGNALMTNRTPIEKTHELVYAEIHSLPEPAQIPLLGLNVSGDPTQDASRKARAQHWENFAEFLPFFAIRPVYNQLLFLTSRVFGLKRAAVLLAVGSYFLLGLLVFQWARRYVNAAFAAAFSLVLMLMPPVTQMGRAPISDAFSTLLALVALWLLFETKREALGITVLLISIFARTDNVVLAAPVLVSLWLMKRLSFWQMTVLGILSAGSVLFINRMAGDYGLAMLYYRNFVGTPTSPAEMVVHFSVVQYLQAFRANIVTMFQSWLMPFLLLAVIGFFRKSNLTFLSAVAVAYLALHFLLLPHWVERWFVVAYIPMALSAIAVTSPQAPSAVSHQNALSDLRTSSSPLTV